MKALNVFLTQGSSLRLQTSWSLVNLHISISPNTVTFNQITTNQSTNSEPDTFISSEVLLCLTGHSDLL